MNAAYPVHLGRLDVQENTESQEDLVHLDHQAVPDDLLQFVRRLYHLADRVRKDLQDLLDQRDLRANLELRDPLEDRAVKVFLANKDQKDHQAHRENKDPRELLENLEIKRQVKHLYPARLGHQASKEVRAQPDPLVRRELPEFLEHQDQKAQRVQKAQLVKVASQDPKVHPAQEDPRARRVSVRNTALSTAESSSRMAQEIAS